MKVNTLLGRLLAAVISAVMLAASAQAALVDRGGGMIYDTTRNITWLANMNANGLMDWNAAVAWADNLVYGGFGDWRLPTLNPADASCTGGLGVGVGYNCTGGELSGLFVTQLGNKPNESVLNQTGDTAEQIANLTLFSNVQSYAYWSGTEFAPDPNGAWYFITGNGLQFANLKTIQFYAMGVRPGDVLAAPVPEPESLLLALTGLGALALVRRRRAVGASVL